ncbi:MAG: rhamnan synthesis F family protein [Candidatus Helarchaeota archaeon]
MNTSRKGLFNFDKVIMWIKDLMDYFWIKNSGYFDRVYYLDQNPDIRISKVDPLMHFVRHGGFEGRDPSLAFNCKWYLKAYDDVRNSKINPLIHYIKFGRKEHRLPNWKAIVHEGKANYSPTLDTVLVVGDEVGEYDNPFFCINLAKFLSKNFNVIALINNDGSIKEHIEESTILILSPQLINKDFEIQYSDFYIKELTREYKIKFAVVSSIVSSAILPALSRRFIPTINLINEFPKEKYAEYNFPMAALWSHRTLFSSMVTYEKVLKKYRELFEQSNEIFYLGHYKILSGSSKVIFQVSREGNTIDQHITQLENIGLNLEKETCQEYQDVSLIEESGVYRPDYYPPNFQRKVDAIIHYVRSWRSSVNRLKLFPGFHPGIYLDTHNEIRNREDPLAHYIRSRMPDGPWKYPVITNNDKIDIINAKQSIALHLHVFYHELLPDILYRLSINQILPDLYVSVTSKDAFARVEKHLKKYKGSIKDIVIVPNQGRDIGAFLTEFNKAFLDHYKIIGHLHTKKSLHLKSDFRNKWRIFLLENLLGGKYKMADIILSKMMSDPSIGMVFPDDPNIFGWKRNFSFAHQLCKKFKINNLPMNFNFPAGTMFWARSDAIRPLFELNLTYDDYPKEPAPLDGSLLHAIERILPLVSSMMGYRNHVTNVAGITR